jgi:hypothetical protein
MGNRGGPPAKDERPINTVNLKDSEDPEDPKDRRPADHCLHGTAPPDEADHREDDA